MIFRDSPTTAFLKVVEALLNDRPEDWASDSYHLRLAAARISIWIANAAYGLHVEIGGSRIDPGYLWKRRLRRAADKCLAAKAVSAIKIHLMSVRQELSA